MAKYTLRQYLTTLLCSGVILTACFILANVWSSTGKMVSSQVQKDLLIAQQVLEQVILDRKRQLGRSARVLADDFGLKDAVSLMLDDDMRLDLVANADNLSTLRSALSNHGERIEADVMLVTDAYANVVDVVPSIMPSGEPFTYAAEQRATDPWQGFMVMRERLYYLVLQPIFAPSFIGHVGVGVEYGPTFIKELSAIVQADIVITDHKSSSKFLLSTQDNTTTVNILDGLYAPTSWRRVTLADHPLYVTQQGPIPEANEQLQLTLAADVSAQYLDFLSMQKGIIKISLLVVIAMLALSLWMSRRVTSPLAALVKDIDLLSNGSREQPLRHTGPIAEVETLSQSFDLMRERILSRERKITYQALHDSLTGLYNRNFLETFITERLSFGESKQVIGITVIGFRSINDLYGYTAGDHCLRVIGQRVKRWPGIAVRIAGGELVYIPDERLNLMQLESIKHMIEQVIEFNYFTILPRVTMGEVECPEDADTTEELLRKLNIVSDAALQSGRWLVPYAPQLETRYIRRLSIITELKKALLREQDELSMVYQPKMDMKTRRITGAEALIRWNSKTLGFVPPDEFISIAEQAGLIEQITRWVITRVVNDSLVLRKHGYRLSIAINFSTQDIQNAALLENLTEHLEQAGLMADDIELEITESDLVQDAAAAISNLNWLRERGFKVAIDDFGTGYSSLAYLKQLPVTAIKIDKSFVLNLAKSDDDQRIVTNILSLAASFELDVVAEGIEDEHSLSLLDNWSCTYGQGYFISRPVTVDALIAWLAEQS